MTGQTKSQSLPVIHIGYIPLVDCAPVVVAYALGFDRDEGFELQAHREVSWANIRDKVSVGHFDCAHMLAPMPLATSLGVHQVREAIIAPMTLSLNGNAITVSRDLWSHMRDVAPDLMREGWQGSAKALAMVLDERKRANAPQLTFGVVFPFSCQNYELRQWLMSAGINPDLDVRLIGLPPSIMAASLAAGQIHGFCAGEPWNSVAVAQGHGCIVASKAERWGAIPEKVLGVRLKWAESQPVLLLALIRALVKASDWLADANNHAAAARLLSDAAVLGQDENLILNALRGQLTRVPGRAVRPESDFVVFGGLHGSRPSRAHTVWLLARMLETGHLSGARNVSYAIDDCARTDLFDRAMAEVRDGRDRNGDGDDAIARHLGIGPGGLESYLENARRNAPLELHSAAPASE